MKSFEISIWIWADTYNIMRISTEFWLSLRCPFYGKHIRKNSPLIRSQYCELRQYCSEDPSLRSQIWLTSRFDLDVLWVISPSRFLPETPEYSWGWAISTAHFIKLQTFSSLHFCNLAPIHAFSRPLPNKKSFYDTQRNLLSLFALKMLMSWNFNHILIWNGHL